jgi:hypothetical protein
VRRPATTASSTSSFILCARWIRIKPNNNKIEMYLAIVVVRVVFHEVNANTNMLCCDVAPVDRSPNGYERLPSVNRFNNRL